VQGEIHALHPRSVVGHTYPSALVTFLGMLDNKTLTNPENAVVCLGQRAQLVVVLAKPPAVKYYVMADLLSE
jgi:hypothetical protein